MCMLYDEGQTNTCYVCYMMDNGNKCNVFVAFWSKKIISVMCMLHEEGQK
jgi:hypothetical protein